MLNLCRDLIFIVIAVGSTASPPFSAAQAKLSTSAEYHRYIGPLLQVKDFGSQYYDDGAADASVLFPESKGTNDTLPRPAVPVINLFRLHEKAFPILIDCLSDDRVTSMRFEGNSITRSMDVPVGYICLDMLMAMTRGTPASDPECSSDGLGACMNDGYYFRPDDYTNCWEDRCGLRPWIKVVQQNWRKQYLSHRLHFFNPYNVLNVEEYKDLETTPTQRPSRKQVPK